MQTTLGHKVSQPGLRGHSHDPAQDLMKQYVVAEGRTRGWLWRASFDTYAEADAYATGGVQMPVDVPVRILDQYNGNVVLWED